MCTSCSRSGCKTTRESSSSLPDTPWSTRMSWRRFGRCRRRPSLTSKFSRWSQKSCSICQNWRYKTETSTKSTTICLTCTRRCFFACLRCSLVVPWRDSRLISRTSCSGSLSSSSASGWSTTGWDSVGLTSCKKSCKKITTRMSKRYYSWSFSSSWGSISAGGETRRGW